MKGVTNTSVKVVSNVTINVKTKITIYLLKVNLNDICFLLFSDFNIFREKFRENISNNIYIAILIIWCGNIYISPNKHPLTLYVKIKADNEKPITNVLTKYINMFTGIPIIEMPSIQIVSIKITFDINADLKLSK